MKKDIVVNKDNIFKVYSEESRENGKPIVVPVVVNEIDKDHEEVNDKESKYTIYGR